jgi:hypothetical protein
LWDGLRVPDARFGDGKFTTVSFTGTAARDEADLLGRSNPTTAFVALANNRERGNSKPGCAHWNQGNLRDKLVRRHRVAVKAIEHFDFAVSVSLVLTAIQLKLEFSIT